MKSIRRLSMAKEAAHDIMKVYYWYWNMGEEMMNAHHVEGQDWQNRAYYYGQEVANVKSRDEFREGCYRMIW
jgi:hypothetical protein